MALTNEFRKQIVDSFTRGRSKEDIADFLNVNLSTIYAVIDVYIKENRVDAKKRSSPRKSLNDAQFF